MNEEWFTRLSEDINKYRITLSSSVPRSIDEIPFELITQDDWRSAGTEEVLELISVWVIDCADNRWISKLFGFLKNWKAKFSSESVLGDLDGLHDQIDHLKTLRSLDSSVGTTILLSAVSSTTFQELTEAMLAYEPIRGLIEQSTPYRIKAPRRASRLQSQSIEWSRQYWPLNLNYSSNLAAKLNGPNQPMLIKQWTPSELTWLLDQLAHVLSLAIGSYRAGELGVATTVSVNHLNQDPSETVTNQLISAGEPFVLADGVDLRTSTQNPLCHAFIQMINNVARLDQLKLRHPLDEKGEVDVMSIPYLLTNLVVFATHEPCLCCSMALLHSRIKHLFYLIPSPGSGGCGSVFHVHEQEGLNHKFYSWKLKSDKLPTSTGFDA
ncbi:hypothetical protein CROQUDRAFT_63429 [Cronartium quercuum f. sp. fusiforme G11]|uniref:CMP/dCMP-type deaminase domain-containing protein n=1 Tax=Cronartium quercuum f. sp. fusiforme G11 TaxID=708437 RepID=A0A9P6NKU3_9BASI|nr:hypothetical protein CROQUDRAFT_63429 [Cronartium quercuum f. sp. fusiforme G11]